MDKIGIECPHCQADNMAPIIYGYPTPEMVQLAREEVIALGGPADQDYTHYCYSCNEVTASHPLHG